MHDPFDRHEHMSRRRPLHSLARSRSRLSDPHQRAPKHILAESFDVQTLTQHRTHLHNIEISSDLRRIRNFKKIRAVQVAQLQGHAVGIIDVDREQ